MKISRLLPVGSFFLIFILSGCGLDIAPKLENKDHISVEPLPRARVKTPCALHEIDEANFRRKMDDFKLRYGIEVQLTPDYDPSLKVAYQPIPRNELSTAEYYFDTMEKLIQLHPAEFLKIADIRAFGFVRQPTFENSIVAGLALFDQKHVVFNIDKELCSEELVGDTFHHELFHMFHNMPTPPSFEISQWMGLNAIGFSYSIQGEKSTEMTHPRMGFVNEYATTDELEDSAETFTTMMVPDYAKALKTWIQNDQVLLQKVTFLKTLLSKVSTTYNGEYWQRIERLAQ